MIATAFKLRKQTQAKACGYPSILVKKIFPWEHPKLPEPYFLGKLTCYQKRRRTS